MVIQRKNQPRTYLPSLWGRLIVHKSTVGRSYINGAANEFSLQSGKDAYRIGRGVGLNDFVIKSPYISMKHLTIECFRRSDGTQKILVEDHNSSNGTFIDGKRLWDGTLMELREGSRLTLGMQPHEIEFIFSERPEDSFQALYITGELLGQGGFGVVKQARHRISRAVSAVKILSKPGLSHPQTDIPQLSEIRLLKHLQHRNIVQLEAVFEDGRNFYIVMELVPHGDLYNLIANNGGLTESEAQTVTTDMCDALLYLHSQNVAHRDIKPQNILVAGQAPLVTKLADFGLAKMVHDGTFLRSFCGTPSFMAPEILSNAGGSYDHKCDSWSLGVTIFMMFSGDVPFEDSDAPPDTQHIQWTVLPEGCSIAVRDLISKLLTNARERLTIVAITRHVWMQEMWQVRQLLLDTEAHQESVEAVANELANTSVSSSTRYQTA